MTSAPIGWIRRTLTNVPSPVACVDVSGGGHVVFVNRQFVRTFGYELVDLADLRDWLAHVCPEASERAQLLSTLTPHEGVVGCRVHAVCKSGQVREVTVQAEGLGELLLLSFIDVPSPISERFRAAERLLRMRNELVLDLARMLRDPLDGVVGAAEFGRRCEDPEEARLAFESIAASGREVLTALDHLLGVR